VPTPSKKNRATYILSISWPAILIALLSLVPFINKAFTIDDPYFLAMARQILQHPLHPMDYEICWNTPPYCAKAYDLTSGNTLMGYFLVPTVLAGTSEVLAHATQILLVIVAILAMASLLSWIGRNLADARLGTLFLVTLPPLLPMASTAMPDVLSLTVGIVGFERLAAWKKQQLWHRGLIAAVALGLAGIARAHVALLIPIGALFLLDSTKPRELLDQVRRNVRLFAPVIAGGIILASVIAITREKSLLLDPPASFSGKQNIFNNLRAYFLYICLPFPVAAYWLAARWFQRRYLTIGVIAAVLIGTGLVQVTRSRHTSVAISLAGAWVVLDLFADSLRDSGWLPKILVFWLLMPLPIVYYGHLPVKYFVPCMPAITIMCLRLANGLPLRFRRALVMITVFAGLGLSVAMLHADAQWANAGRSAMTAFVQPHVAAGQKVWVSGEYWTYAYAVWSGARIIGRDGVPGRGDLIVYGVREGGSLDQFPQRRLVDSTHFRYTFGRTMFEGKGFYSNVVGKWVFGFGNSADDRYELWAVE
jgi:hypothetical protein